MKKNTMDQKIDNLIELVSDAASAIVQIEHRVDALERQEHKCCGGGCCHDKKPYDDKNQPISFFGPHAVEARDYVKNTQLQELVRQELDEFTDLGGGFSAMVCSTDPAAHLGGINRGVCYFGDCGPVAVNSDGLVHLDPTKPMVVGGSMCASGVYVPFGVQEDREGYDCAKKMIEFLGSGDPRPFHIFLSDNEMI